MRWYTVNVKIFKSTNVNLATITVYYALQTYVRGLYTLLSPPDSQFSLFLTPCVPLHLCSALAVSYLYTNNGQLEADAGQEVDVRTEHSQNQFLSSPPAAPLTWLSFPNRFQSPPHIHPRVVRAPFKM